MTQFSILSWHMLHFFFKLVAISLPGYYRYFITGYSHFFPSDSYSIVVIHLLYSYNCLIPCCYYYFDQISSQNEIPTNTANKRGKRSQKKGKLKIIAERN